MKRILGEVKRNQKGVVLPVVLAALALGALIMVPAMSLVSTSLKAGEVAEENVKATYAADAGVEDAIWRMVNDRPSSFPYSYTLKDSTNRDIVINGMTVDVLVEYVSLVGGYDTGRIGVHADWLQLDKSIEYDEAQDVYVYTLSLTNVTQSGINIESMVIEPAPGLDYIPSSTTGAITHSDPEVRGEPGSGVTLIWAMDSPWPAVPPGPDPKHGQYNTVAHSFRLQGDPALSDPPRIPGLAGFVVVTAVRQIGRAHV